MKPSFDEELKIVTKEQKLEARERLEKAREEFYSLLSKKYNVKSLEELNGGHETYITNEFVTNIEVVLTNEESGEILTTNLTVTTISISTNSYETSPMDTLYAKGMLEINGETNAADNYLKEIGLYDEAIEIAEKYNLEEAVKTIYSRTREDVATRNQTDDFYLNTNNLKTGDILLSIGQSSQITSLVALVIPGTWKHAGIMDRRRIELGENQWFIYSASDKTAESKEVVDKITIFGITIWEKKRGACVGWESRQQWKDEAKVSAYRVKNYTEQKGEAALDYVLQFRQKPYGMLKTEVVYVPGRWTWGIIGTFFGIPIWGWIWFLPRYETRITSVKRNENDYWYCTKLCYRAWLSQGINIEYSGGRWDNFVSPDDIRNSINDGTIYHIGGDNPWNP